MELLQKNYEIECQIERLLRFRRILKLVEKRFKMRKKLESKRQNEIGEEWKKKVAEKVQEKLKSKPKKDAKSKELTKQRWLEFQEITRQSTYIAEKAKDLFNFQKMRFKLRDCVVLIVETTRKYNQALNLNQENLANQYAKRSEQY